MMKRHKHVLSHFHNTTFDMGQLVPISCIEVLPGDTFRMNTTSLIRTGPLVRPLMHPVDVTVMSFFVAHRLTYSGFEDFITQNNPAETLPTITLTGSGEELVDRLGVPAVSGLEVNALPVRAYNLIYNEFFRDEQLTTERTSDNTTLARGSWQKDYFTTCRPNPQQGSEGIVNFSTGVVPVKAYDGTYTTEQPSLAATTWGSNTFANMQAGVNYMGADLSESSGGFSINDWRRSMAEQKWAEHRNRFGNRYSDLMASYGVDVGDNRVQRPELVGGGKGTLSFSEVLNVSDAGTDPVGELRGHGIGSLGTSPFTKFFPEFGYLLTLMVVRPRTMYQNAVHRTWLRRQYSDFWHKQFEMEGEQLVTETEIYAQGGNTDSAFGYAPRHDDYRRQPSFVSGNFRGSGSDNDWHMARNFTSAPALNASFVECTPTDRIYADTARPELYTMNMHRCVARRLVSKTARNP